MSANSKSLGLSSDFCAQAGMADICLAVIREPVIGLAEPRHCCK